MMRVGGRAAGNGGHRPRCFRCGSLRKGVALCFLLFLRRGTTNLALAGGTGTLAAAGGTDDSGAEDVDYSRRGPRSVLIRAAAPSPISTNYAGSVRRRDADFAGPIVDDIDDGASSGTAARSQIIPSGPGGPRRPGDVSTALKDVLVEVGRLDLSNLARQVSQRALRWGRALRWVGLGLYFLAFNFPGPVVAERVAKFLGRVLVNVVAAGTVTTALFEVAWRVRYRKMIWGASAEEKKNIIARHVAAAPESKKRDGAATGAGGAAGSTTAAGGAGDQQQVSSSRRRISSVSSTGQDIGEVRVDAESAGGAGAGEVTTLRVRLPGSSTSSSHDANSHLRPPPQPRGGGYPNLWWAFGDHWLVNQTWFPELWRRIHTLYLMAVVHKHTGIEGMHLWDEGFDAAERRAQRFRRGSSSGWWDLSDDDDDESARDHEGSGHVIGELDDGSPHAGLRSGRKKSQGLAPLYKSLMRLGEALGVLDSTYGLAIVEGSAFPLSDSVPRAAAVHAAAGAEAHDDVTSAAAAACAAISPCFSGSMTRFSTVLESQASTAASVISAAGTGAAVGAPQVTVVARKSAWLMIPFPCYVTYDPLVIRHVLRDRFESYEKGPLMKELNEPVFGEGIFNSDGDRWMWQRKAAVKMFTEKRFEEQLAPVFEANAEKLCAMLLENLKAGAAAAAGGVDAGAGEGDESLGPRSGGRDHSARKRGGESPVDMVVAFQKFTLESIGEVGLGEKLNCWQAGAEKGSKDDGGTTSKEVPFVHSWDTVMSCSEARCENPLWKLQRLLNIGTERMLSEAKPKILAWTEDVVERRRKELLGGVASAGTSSSGSAAFRGGRGRGVNHLPRSVSGESVERPERAAQLAAAPPRTDFLSLFIEAKPNLELKDYVDIALNFIAAGRDTTAALMIWTLYELHRPENAAQLARVKQEIDEAYAMRGGGHGGSSGRSWATEGGLRELFPFLTACLNETLRLHPPVARDMKVAVEDDVLPDGTFLPKGTHVIWLIRALGRAPWHWGEDSGQWLPERWLTFATPSTSPKTPKTPAGVRVRTTKKAGRHGGAASGSDGADSSRPVGGASTTSQIISVGGSDDVESLEVAAETAGVVGGDPQSSQDCSVLRGEEAAVTSSSSAAAAAGARPPVGGDVVDEQPCSEAPGEKLHCKRENQFEFPVFNAGPRLCLGQRMAMVQTTICLATLLRTLDFELYDKEEKPLGSRSIVMGIDKGLFFWVSPRRATEPAGK